MDQESKAKSMFLTTHTHLLSVHQLRKLQGKGKAKLANKSSVTFKVLVIIVNPEGVYYDVSTSFCTPP